MTKKRLLYLFKFEVLALFVKLQVFDHHQIFQGIARSAGAPQYGGPRGNI
jgi:hypothetical protein